jgi:hypothetical protein
VLRAIAFVALALLLWRAIRPDTPDGIDAARGNLTASLARWTLSPPREARLALDLIPDAPTRAWARALARAGVTVRWSSTRPLSPTAIEAEPVSEPNAAIRVRVAAPGRDPVSIGDEAGLIDTMPGGGSMELELTSLIGTVRLSGATAVASTLPRDSVSLRPVLVVGAPGWESKFTIAALEERGWKVASRVRIAPKVDVAQGQIGSIDTSRYSAVIALDSSAAGSAGEIARYARSGGGVVLAGNAASIGGLAAVAPGRAGKRVGGVAGAIASAAPRTGLAAYPISAPNAEAVALESRNGVVLVAARRVDAGRVMQVGYDETWRWRMGGGDEAQAAHREWWSRIVAAVAYAPVVSRTSSASVITDETPLASLVDALGPASRFDTNVAPRGDRARVTRILFFILLGALLLEWASRRARGAR